MQQQQQQKKKGAYEKAWMNKVEIQREWIEYKDDPAYPSLVANLPGYVREARRGIDWDAFDDDHQWPLIDTEKYQHFYRDVFFDKEHSNYVSTDQHEGSIGPIIWSIESKKGVPDKERRDLKVLVQSKKGVERVTIPTTLIEECGSVLAAFKQTLPTYSKLKFMKMSGQLIKDRLLKYEDQIVRTVYKFGVLYCREDQTEEDEMYNNEHGSPAFERFLNFLGDRVKLEGFTGYRGGLDVKTNTTGTYSVHTTHVDDCEIMFHVSTLLQYFPADPQQVERKRHLGNDVVLIIFRERGNNIPFNPKVIRSQFNHIFAVFEEDPVHSTPEAPCYRIEIGCKDGVMPFGPDLPDPPILSATPLCRRWLLSKLINSERAAYYAPDFVMKFRNTRKAQLQAIIEESLSAAPKKSLSLGRKTGSNILKNASKMMTVRRSKEGGPGNDSFVISGPRDFRHEAHLDNMSAGGGSFGAVPIMELFMDDYAAGIRPVTDGKKLQKTKSFDEKLAQQLVPRSSLTASGGGLDSFKSSKRKSGGHMPPSKPLPPPQSSSPLPEPPKSVVPSPTSSPQGAKSPSPRKRDNVRSAHYGLSPLILDKPRGEEDSKLGGEADDRSAPSQQGWVVGQPNSVEETEARTRDRQSGPPPKPGGAGATPHKPKRAADMAIERPNKPPPPPPGGSDAKPVPRRRTTKKEGDAVSSAADSDSAVQRKRRGPTIEEGGVRFSESSKTATETNGSSDSRKRSGSKDNGPLEESEPSAASSSSSSSSSSTTSSSKQQTITWESEEKRRPRLPSSPRGERGDDRIGRRRTTVGTSTCSPRTRPSVQGTFTDGSGATSSSSPKASRKVTSPRSNNPSSSSSSSSSNPSAD